VSADGGCRQVSGNAAGADAGTGGQSVHSLISTVV